MKKFFIFLFIAGILYFLPKQAKAALATGDLMAISTSTRFENRCNYYLQLAAVNVMAESSATASHSMRVQYARNILSGTGPTLVQLAIDVLTNTTIAAEASLATLPDNAVPDTDIAFAVNSLFNALAGVAQ